MRKTGATKKFLSILLKKGIFYNIAFLALALSLLISGEKVFGLTALGIWTAMNLVMLVTRRRNTKQMLEYVENMMLSINSAERDTLLSFQLPMVLTESSGDIMWYNASFADEFSEGSVLEDEELGDFLEDIMSEQESGTNFSVTRQYEDKTYNVLGNYYSNGTGDDLNLIMFFIDCTEYASLKTAYEAGQICIGVLMIDNYDELMQGMQEDTRHRLMAEVDSTVNSWISSGGGFARSFDRDRYLIVFDNKMLHEYIDGRFSIMETVKEISEGNKIPVTVSIGIGAHNGTFSANLAAADASIDIALGRGGDHAVVNDKGAISIYGGQSKEIEKRTKVKARVISNALKSMIDQADGIYIMGHKAADFDTLGAALGVYRMCKLRGRTANIVLDQEYSSVRTFYDRLKEEKDYDGVFISSEQALMSISEHSLLVVVDTHRPAMTECPELLAKTQQIVVIDHHRRSPDYISDYALMFQEIYASSACEMVTEMIQYYSEALVLLPIEAECMYTGIMIDTKHFMFKTGVRTFEAAAYLRRYNPNMEAVRANSLQSLETFSQIADIIKKTEFLDQGIALCVVPQGVKNPTVIAAQVADQMLNLADVEASFVLCTYEGKIYISGRSLGSVNVQMILEGLGGGGHQTIAGAQISGSSIDVARKMLIDAIFDKGKK